MLVHLLFMQRQSGTEQRLWILRGVGGLEVLLAQRRGLKRSLHPSGKTHLAQHRRNVLAPVLFGRDFQKKLVTMSLSLSLSLSRPCSFLLLLLSSSPSLKTFLCLGQPASARGRAPIAATAADSHASALAGSRGIQVESKKGSDCKT